MKKLILVYLKFPEPGRVKTRLARDLGEAGAVEAYSRLVRRVFEGFRELEGAGIRVLFDPPERRSEVVEWIGGLTRPWGGRALEFHPQAPGDLGERLERGFEGAFADGWERVVAVGTDCVDLCEATFASAWEALGGAEVVFGPSRDGGYYLVGLKEPRGDVFRGVPWSSEKTLEASIELAEAAGLRVALLEELRDVDTIEDWREVEGRL